MYIKNKITRFIKCAKCNFYIKYEQQPFSPNVNLKLETNNLNQKKENLVQSDLLLLKKLAIYNNKLFLSISLQL